MLVATPDGRAVTVRRRWMPWRLRKREVDVHDTPDFLSGADDLGGVIFGIVLSLVFLLFGGIILSVAVLASEALLILPVLVILFAVLRILWVIPWVIEATYGDTILGIEKVRGWRDSADRLRELAEAYRRGEDPFAARDRTVGT